MVKMIKVAQIGVGYWGPNLLRNLVANNNCMVLNVVDLSEKRRNFVQSNYPQISVTDKISDVINNPDIDAVVISTPVATHFDFAIQCLKANKHILVEKPMATSASEVKEIGKLAKERKLVAMVGHTFLYNSAVQYVKKLINNDELGDLQYIYSQRVNLGRIRNDVDALWNLGPHDISIIQFWLDNQEPVSINRYGQSYVQNDIDDVVFLNMIYPQNIMANIHVSWLDPHKIRTMTLVGSKKMVVYDDIADDKITIFDKGIDKKAILGQNMDYDDPNTFSLNHRSGDSFVRNIDWIEPLKSEVSHFLECIQKGIECITGPEHAEKVVKILEDSS